MQEFRDRAAQLQHEKNILDEREAASRAADDAAAGTAGADMQHVRKNLLNDMKGATLDAGTGSKAGSRPMSGSGASRPEEDSAGGTPEGRRAAPDVAEEKGSAGAGTKVSSSSGAGAGAGTGAVGVYGGSKDDLLEDGDGASRLRLGRVGGRHGDSERDPTDRKTTQPTITLGGASRQTSFAGAGDAVGGAGGGDPRGGLGPDVAEDKAGAGAWRGGPVAQISRQNTSVDSSAAAAAEGAADAGSEASPAEGLVRVTAASSFSIPSVFTT